MKQQPRRTPQPRDIPIPVPVLGLVEGVGGSGQPKATYAAGFNVRSRAEDSEQLGITRRSGFKEFVSGLGAPARELFLASRDTPPYLWRYLTTTPNALLSPQEVEVKFDTDLRAVAIDMALGAEGTLYILRIDGSVDVVNAEGKVVETIESPVPRGFTIVPRIEADESGAIYVAGTRTTTLDGSAGRIYRVRKRNGVWAPHWGVASEDPITDIAYTLNSVYALREPLPASNEEEQVPAQVASIQRYANAQSSLPALAWTRPAPRPAFRVVGLRDGSAIFMSPANALRNDAQTTAFTLRSVGWTPRELPNWQSRVHAWYDGSTPTDGEDLGHEDEVPILADVRRFESSFAPTTDPTERTLVADSDGDFAAPVYDIAAFNGLGGTRFTARTTMMSGPNRDTADILMQESLIPGTVDLWALFMVFTVDVSSLESGVTYRMMSHVGDVNQLALYFVIRAAGTGFQLEIEDLAGVRATMTSSLASQTVMLTLYHDGAGSATSRVRLNGEHIANTSFTRLETGGPWDLAATLTETAPGPRTIFGQHRSAVDHNLMRVGASQVLAPTTAFQNPGILFDDLKVAGTANRVKLKGGSNSAILQVQFTGTRATLDGFVVWTSNSGSQAKKVEIIASNIDFATPEKTYEFNLAQRSSGFPVRDWLDFEEQATYEYWTLQVTEAWGAGFDWGLTEVQMVRRSEQIELAFPLGAGLAPLFSGAPFTLGPTLTLLNPTEPGAVNSSGAGLGALPSSVTEIEAVEGYLAHYVGIAHQLPVDHSYFGPGNFPAGAGDSRTDNGAEGTIGSTLPVMARIAPSGRLVWAYAGGGVGYGVAEGEGGAVVSIGAPFPETGDVTTPGWGTWLRRFYDDGVTLDDGHATAWEQTVATADEGPQARPWRIGLDATNDVYLVRAQQDGTTTLDRRTAQGGVERFAVSVANTPRAIMFVPQVGSNLRNPGDAVTAGPGIAYALRDSAEAGLEAWSVMGQERTGETAPRELEVLAIVGRNLYAIPPGGSASLVSASAFSLDEVWTATLYGKTFIGDGRGYLVYDHEFRTLRSFQGSTKGKFPERCRLGAAWRGRLWLAAGDTTEWAMSRLGDPFDMDFTPEVVDEAQPVSSRTSPIGEIPESMTCLMPWTGDIAYIGCTNAVYRLEGDPASDGRLVPVAPRLGVAFGQGSYCLDENGNLYFMASHGDVYVVRVGNGVPVPLGRGRVAARLLDVNHSIYRPKLVWNVVEKSLNVYFLPRSAYTRGVLHFVWQAEFDAWHIETFQGGIDRVVTAAMAYDGDDPGSRTVLLGFGDGSIGQWDRYADTDMGTPIPWSVTCGPIAERGLSVGGRMTSLYVETSGQGEFNIAPVGTDAPIGAGAPTIHETHRLIAGQRGGISPTAAGALLYLTFFGTDRVTLQAITAGVVPAGRTTL